MQLLNSLCNIASEFQNLGVCGIQQMTGNIIQEFALKQVKNGNATPTQRVIFVQTIDMTFETCLFCQSEAKT